jgi:hypothetical protein
VEEKNMIRNRQSSNPEGAGSKRKRKAAPTNPGPVETDPLRAVLSTQTVTEHTPLKPGDPVQVEWGGSWWAGEVVELQDDGQVYIHFVGWDGTDDGPVPRSRLCLSGVMPKSITVMLDNQQTLTGALVSSAGEFIVLLRDGDAVKTFINKQKVLYIDVTST